MKRQISLVSAILINLNIIIGAGIFVNPRPLTQLLSSWGPVAYLAAAFMLLPLIICLAELAALHPDAGGLYVYSEKYISPFAGFISGWGYFVGKSTSGAFLTLTFTRFIQTLVPQLAALPLIPLSSFILFFLITLNILGVHIGGKIQWLFISLKAIPIGFVLFSGFLFSKTAFVPATPLIFDNLFPALPIATFAMLGFEVTCSIGHLIKNPRKNARRAVLFSFLLVAGIAILFQFNLFRVLGMSLAYDGLPLKTYTFHIFKSVFWSNLLNTFVFTSIIGGSFGILTSNCWNLFILAKQNLVPFSSQLSQLSKTGVPWISLLAEGCLGVFILCISSKQIALQNMAVFGMFMSYFLSIVAATKAFYQQKQNQHFFTLSLLALVSCSYILFLCGKRIMSSGISYSFLLVILGGILSAWFRKNNAA